MLTTDPTPPVTNADLAPPAPVPMGYASPTGGVVPPALRAAVRGALSEYAVLLLAVAYFLVAWAFVPGLVTERNLTNVFMNVLPLLAVAIGQTVVMITGGIDLSVTSVIAAASVAAAWAMTGTDPATGFAVPHPSMVPAGIALALLVGVSIGCANGVAVTVLDVPPFIVTLSMMMTLSGATLWATKSQGTGNLPDAFTNIAFGQLRLGRAGSVPYALLIVGPLALAVHLLLSRTLLGHWIYATGHNPRAALVSGVPVKRVTVAAYVLSGLCAAVASVLYTARLESGQPTMGQRLLLDVVGAAVIGGTSLFGGKGKVLWTVFGVALFALISNTLELLNLQHFTIMMVKGAVILAAAGVDLLRNRVLARM